MSEWIDIKEQPLPRDVKHPLFAVEWPIFWVCHEKDTEARMAHWWPVSKWVNDATAPNGKRWIEAYWQFTELGDDDDFELPVRWYIPIEKPVPPL